MNVGEFRNGGVLQGRLHVAEIAGVRKNGHSLSVVLRITALLGRMRQAIQARVHAGDDKKQADNQKTKDFKKTIHDN